MNQFDATTGKDKHGLTWEDYREWEREYFEWLKEQTATKSTEEN
jgi:hypothetical protein